MSKPLERKRPSTLHRILKQAERVSKQSSADSETLQEAYEVLWRIVDTLAEVSGRDPDRPPDKSTSSRITIIANLVQSLEVTRKVISSGYYFAAVALIRQQMEAVARLGEHSRDVAGRRTPNVGGLPLVDMGVNYGRLSDIAHSGVNAGLGQFVAYPGRSDTVSLSPVYSAAQWDLLLAMHVENFLGLVAEWHELQRETYSSESVPRIERDIEHVLELLVHAGHLKRLER